MVRTVARGLPGRLSACCQAKRARDPRNGCANMVRMTHSLAELRFHPSRCEGAPGPVEEVRVDAQGVELIGPGGPWRFAFQDMRERRWLRRSSVVGERDWFHSPTNRFVRFYTAPPITIYMPASDTRAGETYRALLAALRGLGFTTHDLG